MAEVADVPESVDVKAMGVEVHASGQKVVAAVIGVGAALAIGYFAYIHHTQMEQDDRAILEQLNEMVYVLALPEQKRADLQLAMPESLRNKIRRRHLQDDSP